MIKVRMLDTTISKHENELALLKKGDKNTGALAKLDECKPEKSCSNVKVKLEEYEADTDDELDTTGQVKNRGVKVKLEEYEADTDDELDNTKEDAEEGGDGSNKRRKLELPTLTEDEKTVVLIQYKKDNPTEDAEAVLEEYLKFMYIKIRQDGGACAPSKTVDDMWVSYV